MVGLSFLNRCHMCGSKEGLARCIICGKQTCRLHTANGRCHGCIERETLPQRTPRIAAESKRVKLEEKQSDVIFTKIKCATDPLPLLADLYLLLGGRPGSQRSNTLMGSLDLDQRNKQLMFDRQVARRINATTFVRFGAVRLGEVETRPYWNNPTRRVAHDQILRMIDLVSRALSAEGIQVIGGDPLLEEVELIDDLACPRCGSWREVCLCRDRPQGTMSASEYFRTSMANRFVQWGTALRMQKSDKNEELRRKIRGWRTALEAYL